MQIAAYNGIGVDCQHCLAETLVSALIEPPLNELRTYIKNKRLGFSEQNETDADDASLSWVSMAE